MEQNEVKPRYEADSICRKCGNIMEYQGKEPGKEALHPVSSPPPENHATIKGD